MRYATFYTILAPRSNPCMTLISYTQCKLPPRFEHYRYSLELLLKQAPLLPPFRRNSRIFLDCPCPWSFSLRCAATNTGAIWRVGPWHRLFRRTRVRSDQQACSPPITARLALYQYALNAYTEKITLGKQFTRDVSSQCLAWKYRQRDCVSVSKLPSDLFTTALRHEGKKKISLVAFRVLLVY